MGLSTCSFACFPSLSHPFLDYKLFEGMDAGYLSMAVPLYLLFQDQCAVDM